MQLIAPVTDYIPASILTNQRDIIVRGVTGPERLGEPAYLGQLSNYPAGAYPLWNRVDAAINTYFKAQGVGFVPLMLPLALRDTGIHMGFNTRAGGGTQVITGVGFQTSLIIFLAIDLIAGNLNWSIGFDTLTQHCSLSLRDASIEHWITLNNSIWVQRAAANLLRGTVSAIGGDGFTISWTLVGACATNYLYVCLP